MAAMYMQVLLLSSIVVMGYLVPARYIRNRPIFVPNTCSRLYGSSRGAKSGDSTTYRSILNGKIFSPSTCDLSQVEKAIEELSQDTEMLSSSQNALIKALISLDSCRAPSHRIVYWWNVLTAAGAIPSPRAFRSFLAQSLSRGRGEHATLKATLDAVLEYPPWSTSGLWNTVTCNLFLQAAFESGRLEDAERLSAFLFSQLESCTSSSLLPSPLPDTTTLVLLVKGHGGLGEIEKAQAAYQMHTLLPDDIRGDADAAPEKEMTVGSSASRTSGRGKSIDILNNALLTVYAKAGMSEEAEVLAASMKWDAYTFNTVLGLYGDLQDLEKCRDLWRRFSHLLRIDPVSLHSLGKITSSLACPSDRVGIVIGTKGSTLKTIMAMTGTSIRVNLDVPVLMIAGTPTRKVIVTGEGRSVETARRLLIAVIADGPAALLEAAPSLISTTTDTLQSQHHPRPSSDAQPQPSESKPLNHTLEKARSVGYSIMAKILVDKGGQSEINEAMGLLSECPMETVGMAIAYALGRRPQTSVKSSTAGQSEYSAIFSRVADDVHHLIAADRIFTRAGVKGALGSMLSSLMAAYSVSEMDSTHSVLAYLLTYHGHSASASDCTSQIPPLTMTDSTRLTFLPLGQTDIFGNTKAFNLLLAASARTLEASHSHVVPAASSEPTSSNVAGPVPVFASPAALWAFLRALLHRRVAATNRRLVDEISISSSLAACAAARDVAFASQLFSIFSSPMHDGRASQSPSPSRLPSSVYKSTLPRPTVRLLHSYLRCFTEQSPAQLDALVLALDERIPRAIKEWALVRDARLQEESTLAVLRVCGLPAALRVAEKGIIIVQHSGVAAQTLLLSFDRFWRDYGAPLPRAEPLSESDTSNHHQSRHLDDSHMYLSLIGDGVVSAGQRSSFSEGTSLFRLLLAAGKKSFPAESPCRTLSDLLELSKNTGSSERLKHLAAFSAILAAWMARGEHALVQFGLQMLAQSHSLYSDYERGVVLELAVYSALGAQFPLITASPRTLVDVLLASNESKSGAKGIASPLGSVDRSETLLIAESLRVTCTLGDVIQCLETIASSSEDPVAISSSLLQVLFEDAIMFKKAPAARRIVRLLGSFAVISSGREESEDGKEADKASEASRLARQWTALLVGRSLTNVGRRVAGSLRSSLGSGIIEGPSQT